MTKVLQKFRSQGDTWTGRVASCRVWVTVGDRNDHPPVVEKPLQRLLLGEDVAEGAVVAIVTATDQDQVRRCSQLQYCYCEPFPWWLGLVSIYTSYNVDFLGVKYDSRLTFEGHVHGIVSVVSQRIGILMFVKRVFVDTSLLLRCYYAFVLKIFKYCSPVWGSAAKCHL